VNRSAVGNKGESLARKALRNKGMRVLARNYRTRLGEVDLVCQDRDTVVFVEVKARTSDAFGHPSLVVHGHNHCQRACHSLPPTLSPNL